MSRQRSNYTQGRARLLKSWIQSFDIEHVLSLCLACARRRSSPSPSLATRSGNSRVALLTHTENESLACQDHTIILVSCGPMSLPPPSSNDVFFHPSKCSRADRRPATVSTTESREVYAALNAAKAQTQDATLSHTIVASPIDHAKSIRLLDRPRTPKTPSRSSKPALLRLALLMQVASSHPPSH